MYMKRRMIRQDGRGFTLVEMITVLIVIGIVAAFIIVRMMDTRSVDLNSQLDVVKNHLRYAQSRAMATASPWGVTFATSKTYFLFRGSAPTTPVIFQGEDNTTVDLSAKKSALTITSASAAPQTITFDAYGSPGGTTITVTTNGGNIIVTKNTGYIP